MKNAKLERLLITMLQDIYSEYKKEYPDGNYLNLTVVDGNMMVSNAYFAEDFEHQINAYLYEGEFHSADETHFREEGESDV